jgi:ABC-type phosphonate transport system ATPase subunit
MSSTTQPEGPVFVARGLTKVYGSGDSRVVALKDVDLDIRQGEFIVLLGHSGGNRFGRPGNFGSRRVLRRPCNFAMVQAR